MAIDYPSYEDLVAQIRSEFRNQLPSVDPTIFGSWARAFADGQAVLSQSNLYIIRDLEKQLFPQTATEEFLEIWGGYEDLERLDASSSIGMATLAGVAGTVIPALTSFTGSNGIEYQSTSVSTITSVNQNIATITRSGTTATATFNADHQLASGIDVVISGATQPEYNGTFDVTVTARDEFTFQVSGTPASPATGTPVYDTDIASISFEALSTGLETNLESGANVTNATYGTAITQYDGFSGGASEETDDEYRTRILLSRSIREGIFTPDQIKLAALSVAGNTRAFIKKPVFSTSVINTISSLTSVATTATAVCTQNHGLLTDTYVRITGAADPIYNITAQITVTAADTYTYTVAAGAVTPDVGSPVWDLIGDYLLPEPGQTSVFILRDNDANITPTQTILDLTKDIIIEDGSLPANMSEDDLFVEAPTLVSTAFDFTALSPDTPTMRQAVQNQLEAFFEDTVDFETAVTEASYLGAIQNTQDLQTGAFIVSFTLSTPSGNIAISTGEIASLGAVTFTI